MTPEIVTSLARQSVTLLLVIVLVLILPGLVVGLCISIFQAATQINEQSLSFIPRLIVTFVTFAVAAHWLIKITTEFTIHTFEMIPSLIG